VITLDRLTKRFGERTAVDGLSLDIAPGKVTGFLGPNGAGKSTTIRMILGLDRPSDGRALVNGRPFAESPHPMREIGALLDAKAVHPGRTARKHLLALARTHALPVRRVETVLAAAGLTEVADRRAGTFSLGMGQRLGIASALLGDPETMIFDEPVNGLDPDGVLWVRRFIRSLAAEGRTVFVSSHLMSEMQLTADQLVVIGRGRLLADAPMAEVIAGSSRAEVRVRVPAEGAGVLAWRLKGTDGGTVTPGQREGELVVSGLTTDQVGAAAFAQGLPVLELQATGASLEEAYMELTAGSVEFGGATGGAMSGAMSDTTSGAAAPVATGVAA
jgi:ABC-2 type transport system ATP-binding protein